MIDKVFMVPIQSGSLSLIEVPLQALFEFEYKKPFKFICTQSSSEKTLLSNPPNSPMSWLDVKELFDGLNLFSNYLDLIFENKTFLIFNNLNSILHCALDQAKWYGCRPHKTRWATTIKKEFTEDGYRVVMGIHHEDTKR